MDKFIDDWGFFVVNLKYFIAGLGGFIANALGGYDLLLQTVALLTLFDVVCGVFQAIYNCNFNSVTMRRGIFHKIGIYLTICVAVVIEHFLGDALPIRETVITFYIVMEGMSVLENLGKAIEYPDVLKNVFEQLKTHAEANEQEVLNEVNKHE